MYVVMSVWSYISLGRYVISHHSPCRSSCGWDHVVEGLVMLGFQLMENAAVKSSMCMHVCVYMCVLSVCVYVHVFEPMYLCVFVY